MSDQERMEGQDQQDDAQMQDLDVDEQQQDDVTGGAMRRGREDKRM